MNMRQPSPKDAEKTRLMSQSEMNAALEAEKRTAVPKTGSEKFSILRNTGGETDKASIIIHEPLDYLDGQRLRNEVGRLLARNVQQWEIDLSGLRFCDSATIGFCLMVHLLIQKISGRLIVRLLRDSQIHEIFKISRLDRIMTLEFA